MKKEVKGDIVTYTRTLVSGDKRALLKRLRQLAKSKDPEEAHDEAEMLLLEYLDDEAISKAYQNVPKWYA